MSVTFLFLFTTLCLTFTFSLDPALPVGGDSSTGGTAADPPRVILYRNYTWSLLAWGFNNGGKDTNTGMKVVDVDIDEQKDLIKGLVDDGHIVLCYFSSGTLEPWRDDCQANKTSWQQAAVGKMTDWDEEWLDIRKLDLLQSLMIPRFQRAKSQGCHGVEPDNIDCYDNDDCWSKMTNPTVSSGDKVKDAQVAYNNWQAQYAHSLGLAIAMKNAVGLVDTIGSMYDCAVNEQCQTYDECDGYSAFTNNNKAVFQVEYTLQPKWCTGALNDKMMTKYCSGSDSSGLCNSGSWTDCFRSTVPLPPTVYTNFLQLLENDLCALDKVLQFPIIVIPNLSNGVNNSTRRF